jgi:GNAT superfamily N-acetyltransferase
MKLTKRLYQCENDYWRLRAFLRDVFLYNDRQEYSWQAARLDYWYWFGNPNLEHYALNETISIWETDEGDVAAFVTPESRGHAYLQVNLALRTPALEAEMLEAAEAHLSLPDDEGKRHLTVWAHQRDSLRQELLRARGYTRGDWAEHQFRRCLESEIADVLLPAGYTVRSLGDTAEIPARSWLSWRVFHPDEPAAHYLGWAWYPDIQRCPLYRRDLDLVAVAPNGDLAAFCTVWYDDVTRTGYFEPVGTSPDHQRKGLGRAIMTEGLRRLKHMGALYATVAGYSQAAIALYSSVMSPEFQLFERWEKTCYDTERR